MNIKKILLLVILSLGIGISGWARAKEDVNVVFDLEKGVVGNIRFKDYVKQNLVGDGKKQSPTYDIALNRVKNELLKRLQKGLYDDGELGIYGFYPEAKFILKVTFLDSNEDGQDAVYRFELTDCRTGDSVKVTDDCHGGRRGSVVNLMGDCLEELAEDLGDRFDKFIKVSRK